ncbi:kinase-like domain-containing protein [Aspergillus filifer]
MKPSLPRLSVSSLLRKKPFRSPSGSPFPRPPSLAPNNGILVDEEISPFYDSKLFYPARPGEVLGRYQILVKVGDLEGHEPDPETVIALKICGRSSDSDASLSSVSATHEREIEEHISSANPSHPGRSFLRTYLDAFEIQGSEKGSSHLFLVYPPMRETLATYQRRFEGRRVPLELGKVYIKALLSRLDYLHAVGRVVHTDLKPENILLTFESPIVLANFMETHLSTLLSPNPNATSFKINPSGRAIYPSQTDFGPLRSLKSIWPIQADCYRAPGVILGSGWRFPVDIWNMGVLMWDLLSGQELFQPQQIHDANGLYVRPEHIRVKREDDGKVCESAEEYFRGPFFNDDGAFLYKDFIPSNGNRGKEKDSFLDLALNMRHWHPDRRKSAGELAKHPFLQPSRE